MWEFVGEVSHVCAHISAHIENFCVCNYIWSLTRVCTVSSPLLSDLSFEYFTYVVIYFEIIKGAYTASAINIPLVTVTKLAY